MSYHWILVAPEVTIDGDQKRYLANGTDLLLTCQFNALPTVSEVQWVKDGIVIASTLITPSNGSRVTISHHNESQTQLSIIAVSLEDAGNYTCNVTNNVGSSSSNWTSIVIQGMLRCKSFKSLWPKFDPWIDTLKDRSVRVPLRPYGPSRVSIGCWLLRLMVKILVNLRLNFIFYPQWSPEIFQSLIFFRLTIKIR